MIRRGDRVRDRTDLRHVGTVVSIAWRDMRSGDGLALVRWDETNWLSNVETQDLRAVREPRPLISEVIILKRRLEND
jgi:hypothetical protein